MLYKLHRYEILFKNELRTACSEFVRSVTKSELYREAFTEYFYAGRENRVPV